MTLVNAAGTIHLFSNAEHENCLLLAAENTSEELLLAGDFGASFNDLTQRAIKHVSERLGVGEQSVRNAQIGNEAFMRGNSLGRLREKITVEEKEEAVTSTNSGALLAMPYYGQGLGALFSTPGASTSSSDQQSNTPDFGSRGQHRTSADGFELREGEVEHDIIGPDGRRGLCVVYAEAGWCSSDYLISSALLCRMHDAL
ncbi:hypothetical protein AC578_7982 [Pseudocercospora eumusae]|uniref:Uncharacterized protein n=1 Tax=Pseudocercospora eumusae TaxID=321146 RepID=A0A139H0G1_9PEZI|nr:hypothetical protein AC578_7982 [Pseudocercospora eumusae]